MYSRGSVWAILRNAFGGESREARDFRVAENVLGEYTPAACNAYTLSDPVVRRVLLEISQQSKREPKKSPRELLARYVAELERGNSLAVPREVHTCYERGQLREILANISGRAPFEPTPDFFEREVELYDRFVASHSLFDRTGLRYTQFVDEEKPRQKVPTNPFRDPFEDEDETATLLH